ncbi:uncharacterized protein ACR2FA_010514 [Aphomia sociella]
MDTASTMNLKKFGGEGYRQWKFQLRCALAAKGLSEQITSNSEPEKSKDAIEKWRLNDAKAMFIITASMELPQICLIETCTTAKNMFDKLDSIYENKSENSKLLLHEKYHTIKMADSESMAEFIAKVENIAQQLRDAGENISETSVVTKILGSLPEKYRVVRQAWLSLDTAKQTVINLTARLIDEETSLKASDDIALATSTVAKSKKQFRCFKCNKKGHYARNCNKNTKKSLTPESAFTADNIHLESNVADDESCWILDSGASAHMTYRRDYLCDFRPQSNFVRLGDKSELTVLGVGTAKIKKLVNGQWYNSTINNVLYVPDLKRNLFSEGVVTSKGFNVIKTSSFATIRESDGTVVACACKQSNNLYKLMFRTVICDEANLVSLQQWHERLGHVNIKTLREMVQYGHITAVKDSSDFFCEACVLGKQHRLPFKASKKSATIKNGDKIYSDLCGPLPTPSVSGARYFITFIDSCTRYVVVYFLKHKGEALEAFKRYVQMVENKWNTKVKILHSDNGKEYCNELYRAYALQKGIELEYTAPYTPEQNGRSERANRTIMESARAMLIARNLPLYLWAEAVQTAVYLMNRRSNKPVTPYEQWTGKKPSLVHVRTFGCDAYMHIPKEKRNKLDKKSQKLILVGYDGYSDNYRLYDKHTRKVLFSRDVVFCEKSHKFSNDLCKNDVLISGSSDSNEEDVSCNGQSYEYDKLEDFVHSMVKKVVVEGNDISQSSEASESEKNMNVESYEQGEQNLKKTYCLRSRSRQKKPECMSIEANLIEVIEPVTYEEAVTCNDKEKWQNAIQEELQSHKECKTWKLVERPENKQTVGCKWVFKVKQSVDNTVKYKARLCAKGYSQQPGIDYEETFSPTVRFDIIRLMLSHAAREKLHIMQFDVKTAFLYGTLKEEIYMDPPPGLETHGLVCRLIKSLYGLKQSPRCWNQKFGKPWDL